MKHENEMGIAEKRLRLSFLKHEIEIRIGEKRLMVQPLEKVDGNTGKLARLPTVFHHGRALLRSRTFARRDAKPRLEKRHQSYHHADVGSLRNLNALSNRLSVNSITSVSRCNGLLPEFILYRTSPTRHFLMDRSYFDIIHKEIHIIVVMEV